MLTDSNYDSTVAILFERFGKKYLVVNADIAKLQNLAPVKRSSDVAALGQLCGKCEIKIHKLIP